jgi:hypothetical protein
MRDEARLTLGLGTNFKEALADPHFDGQFLSHVIRE